MTLCDHCGKEATGEYWLEYEAVKGDGGQQWYALLCDSCAKPIIELLEKKPA